MAVTQSDAPAGGAAASTRTAQGLVGVRLADAPDTAAATSAGAATQVRGRMAAKMGESAGGGGMVWL